MRRSEGRTLTTHAGSLPRPRALVELFARKSRREAVDEAALGAAIEDATRDAVTRQLDAGIDVGNNGEQPRESFFTYVQHRLSGFAGASQRPVMRDIVHYRSFLEFAAARFGRPMVSLGSAPQAVGEVRYVDRTPVEKECADYHRIAAAAPRRFVEPFMSAASPGIVAAAMINAYYARHEDYVLALADALRVEYEHIVSQGFVLQLDCPDLAME